MPRRILVIDDDPFSVEDAIEALEAEDYTVHVATTPDEARKLVDTQDWLALLLDYKLEDADGLELLREIHRDYPNVPIIMVTGMGEYDVAVEAIKSGAYHFLRKPIDLAQLLAVIRNVAETVRLREERRQLLERLRHGRVFVQSRSASMRQLQQVVERIAPTGLTILIRGESGTGKEVLAEHIHALSKRADGPFVAINCAAIPETLLESELFGHVRGAFTGAVRSQRGKLEMADGGTLFLDEIGDMPLSLQAKMLRFLENREFQRVGGTETLKVDVRIIAATHQNLKELVKEKRFRQDLYYRINQVELELPPLRERKEDIPVLAQHFVDMVCEELGLPPKRLSPAALARLELYDYPGNVRELRNIIERSVILQDGEVIDVDVGQGRLGLTGDGPVVRPLRQAVDEFRRKYITYALSVCKNNQTEAARLLGINRSYLNQLLRRM